MKTRFSNEKGAELVEFTLIIPAILMTALLGCELLYMSYGSLVLQFVSTRTARFASVMPHTGEIDLNAIRMHSKQLSSSFGIPVNDSDIQICSISQANCSENTSIQPRDLFVLKVSRNFSIMYYLQTNISGIAVAKMEP